MNAIGLNTPMAATFSPALSSVDPLNPRSENAEELAQQFESLFVSMLVKEMRQASSTGEGLFPGDDSDTYGGLFDLYLGQHIAECGGIGLSESIAASIAHQNGESKSFPAES